MADQFKFALVGSGNIAATYVQAINNIPDASITGIVSRSGHKPKGLEDTSIPVAPALTALETAFDGVILCTPNGRHHQDAIEAARLKKHVLTEKVLDITREAMDRMIHECRTNNVKLGVTYQSRTYPDNITVKQLLDNGTLGKIYAADLYAKFYRGQDYYDSAPYRGDKKTDGGGPFIQQAAHSIDLYCWFFGRPAKIVSMYDTFAHDMEGEDHGVALLKYGDGMIGSITASTAAKPGFAPRFEIHADKGTVIMENNRIITWAIDDIENPATSPEQELHSGASSAAVTETSGHEAIIKDFITAVREDREPMAAGESARIATDVILDIYDNKIQ